jgi:Ankyrin repeats (3 copies)
MLSPKRSNEKHALSHLEQSRLRTKHRRKKAQSRIPDALKAVYLNSNSGGDIDQATPQMVCTWFSQEKKVPLLQSLAPDASINSSDGAIDPQVFLNRMLKKRGYCTTVFSSTNSAYYNRPTPLQQASYDLYLVNVAKNGDTKKLKEIIDAGLSPNPANSFGDSLLHMICRRGWDKVLSFLVDELRVDVRVSDDHGRTPLHESCVSTRYDYVCVLLYLVFVTTS